jgi:hypothetical protein
LQKLTSVGLLKRVRLIATDNANCSGSLPALFFLTIAGGDLVERELGRRPPRITASDPKPFTLRHRRATVHARLAIDHAAHLARIPAPEWIMEQDCRGDGKKSSRQSPSDCLVLNNRFHVSGSTIAFRPDAACHIHVPFQNRLATLLAYLEVDRSTEGHGQWIRKLQGIEAFTADPKAWQDHWPAVRDARVRIFVLCKSKQRIANLIETSQSSAASDRIYFTTYPINAASVLTEYVWLDCNGNKRAIIQNLTPPADELHTSS